MERSALLVEGHAPDRKMLVLHLSKGELDGRTWSPIDVDEATTLAEAESMLVAKAEGGGSYGLIIADLRLPDSESPGDTIVRLHQLAMDTPIIVWSGLHDEQTADELARTKIALSWAAKDDISETIRLVVTLMDVRWAMAWAPQHPVPRAEATSADAMIPLEARPTLPPPPDGHPHDLAKFRSEMRERLESLTEEFDDTRADLMRLDARQARISDAVEVLRGEPVSDKLKAMSRTEKTWITTGISTLGIVLWEILKVIRLWIESGAQ